MKAFVALGLVWGFFASACAASTPAAGTAAREASAERTCQGPVTITSTAALRSVGAACMRIEGELWVVGTDLESLDGLEALHAVDTLVVAQNAKLTSIAGLRGLRSAKAVHVIDNPALDTLRGLEGVEHVDALVVANDGLSRLTGLEGLKTADLVVIASNPVLASLEPLSASVTTLEIDGNGEQSARAASGTPAPPTLAAR
jgi:hypothetical protein